MKKLSDEEILNAVRKSDFLQLHVKEHLQREQRNQDEAKRIQQWKTELDTLTQKFKDTTIQNIIVKRYRTAIYESYAEVLFKTDKGDFIVENPDEEKEGRVVVTKQ